MKPFSSMLIFSAALSRALWLSPQWTGFIARLISVYFVVVTSALRQVCLWVLWPSFVTVIQPMLHICVLCPGVRGGCARGRGWKKGETLGRLTATSPHRPTVTHSLTKHTRPYHIVAALPHRRSLTN